jgi:hypothetical protein
MLLLSLGSGDQGTTLRTIPFLVLVIMWIMRVFVIRLRNREELQREIDGERN